MIKKSCPEIIKNKFMLNSAEHEILNAHNCKNSKTQISLQCYYSWYFINVFLSVWTQSGDAYSTCCLTVVLWTASRIPGCSVLIFLMRKPKLLVPQSIWLLKFKSDEISTPRYRAWSTESRTCPCVVQAVFMGLHDLDMCKIWDLDGLNYIFHAASPNSGVH